MAVRVTARAGPGDSASSRSRGRREALPAAILVAVLLPLVACSPDPPSGGAIYQVRCAFCHGSAGAGDGPAGRRMQPPPTDFTAPAFWATHTPDQLRATILRGVSGTAMPGYAGTLTEAQLTALVSHLEKLRPGEAQRSR